MVKPLIGNTSRLDDQHVNTKLTEDDRIRKPSIVDSQGQSKRILVVDDNSDVAFTHRIGLEDKDATMQVYSYDNAVKALADFKPNFYDLVLVDVNMPLMNGFELCQKLLCRKISISKCAL